MQKYDNNEYLFNLFFKENERNTNQTVSLCLIFVSLVNPLMFILCIIGVFKNVDSKILLIVACIIVVASILNYIYCKKKVNSTKIKFFCILLLHFSIFCLSFIPGISPFISYIIPPLLSCLYFNEKFTLRVSILSYVMMLINLAIRSVLQLPILSIGLTPKEWFLAFGLGCSIEYIIFCVFAYFLTKESRKSLIKVYLRKLKIKRIKEQIIEGFANIVESKDVVTGEHIQRTSLYVELICKKLLEKKCYPLEVTEHTCNLMIRAAPFHDLGKLKVPDNILNKKGCLSPEEFKVIMNHPMDGASFITNNLNGLEDKELLEMAFKMSLCHHEKLDGTGYPLHLISDEIPVCARIMSAADIIDALLSKRPYKEPYSIEQAFIILSGLSGNALDPIIVDILLNSKSEIEEILKRGEYNDRSSI